MRYLILVLMFTASFSQELEVEGNLKVQGNIDASNQRVTNVGSPTDLTDAVNTEFLQDALRDDGNYEYKVYLTRVSDGDEHNIMYVDSETGPPWGSYFVPSVLMQLLNDGWKIDRTVYYGPNEGDGTGGKQLYIFKRPLEE